MNIHEWDGADKYEYLHPIKQSDWYERLTFSGVPLKDTWTPVKMRFIRSDGLCSSRLPGDFPWVGSGMMTFSVKAAEQLRPLLEPNGELLSLDCEGSLYYAYNATQVIAALDTERSRLLGRHADGRIMAVLDYAFHVEKLRETLIFRLAEVPTQGVFATDAFAEAVEDCGLTGYAFRTWSWTTFAIQEAQHGALFPVRFILQHLSSLDVRAWVLRDIQVRAGRAFGLSAREFERLTRESQGHHISDKDIRMCTDTAVEVSDGKIEAISENGRLLLVIMRGGSGQWEISTPFPKLAAELERRDFETQE